MKAFLSRLSQFLKDDTGQLSAMRLLFLGWGLGTLGVWLFLSIKTMTMIALPWSITGFISSLTAGKVIQSFTENTPSGSYSGTIGTGGADLPVTGSNPSQTVIITSPGTVVVPTAQTPVSGSVGPVPSPAPLPPGTTSIP